MDPSEFHAPEAGEVVSCPEGYAAFSPAPLPPKLTYTPEFILALSRSDAAFGELSGVGGEMPDPQLLDAPCERQEALCSSRIEGVEMSLYDLLLDQVAAASPSCREITCARYGAALPRCGSAWSVSARSRCHWISFGRCTNG